MSRRLVCVAAPGVTHESTIAPGHSVCCTVAHINPVRSRGWRINCSMPHIRRGTFVLALHSRFDSGSSTLLWQQYSDAYGNRDPAPVNNGTRSPVRLCGFVGPRLSLISEMPAVAAMPDPRPAMSSCLSAAPAAIAPLPDGLALFGCWTAFGISPLDRELKKVAPGAAKAVAIDGARVEALDTVGVCVLQHLLQRLRDEGVTTTLRGWRPEFERLIDLIEDSPPPPLTPAPSAFTRRFRADG